MDADARSDEEKFAAYGEVLADGIEAALPGWVVAQVVRLLSAWTDVPPGALDRAVLDQAEAAGRLAAEEVGAAVRALLALDVDDQHTNPLAVVRHAVRYPTEVLRAAGVPPVVRDDVAERQFPDDLYDLTPGRFADLDPSLHEAGLVWGAAKAHLVKQRHQR